MSLFEKLKNIQKEHSPQSTAEQETPPVVEQKQETPPVVEQKQETPPSSTTGHVLDKLRAIGDAQHINPPPVVEQETPPVVEQETPPVVEQETSPAPVEEQEGEMSALEKKVRQRHVHPEKCPTCGKTFKHLAKHRCKLADVAGPTEPPPPEPPIEETPPEASSPDAVEQTSAEDSSKPNISIKSPYFEVDIPPETAMDYTDSKYDDDEPPIIPAGFDLYIDCVIYLTSESGPKAQYFADIIGPLAGNVASENRVPYWSTVEFGKGPGLLADKLERWLKKVQPSGTVFAMSNSPEFRACYEVLIRNARTVTRGII